MIASNDNQDTHCSHPIALSTEAIFPIPRRAASQEIQFVLVHALDHIKEEAYTQKHAAYPLPCESSCSPNKEGLSYSNPKNWNGTGNRQLAEKLY